MDVISIEKDKIYKDVKRILEERVKVSCTDCKYCMPCPVGVDIPANFIQYNKSSIYEDIKGPSYVYQNAVVNTQDDL